MENNHFEGGHIDDDNDGYALVSKIGKDEEPDSSDDGVASGEYLSSEEGTRAKRNTFLGIQMKREFGFCQWLALPLVSTGTMSVGMYLQTQLTYMLQEPEGGFNIPKSEIGIVTSALTMYSLPFTMVMTAISGYLFEFTGRKWTIFLSFFTTAILFVAIPYTAPSYAWLVVVRCMIGITMAAPCAHPLVADYVVKKSRSQGLALMGIGVVFGTILSMGVLFQLTKNMTFHNAFFVAGMYVMAMSLLYLTIVRDPNLESLRRGLNTPTQGQEQNQDLIEIANIQEVVNFENQSLWSKSKDISSLLFKQLGQKPILPICIIGGTVCRLLSVLCSTYLILWVSALQKDDGEDAQSEGKQTYINLMLMSVFLSGIAFPVVGKVCDNYDAHKIAPSAFMLRSIMCFIFTQINNPSGPFSYVIVALISVSSVLEQISVDSIFSKALFKETRGMMFGLYSLANMIGILFYSLVAGYTFDVYGPSAPFMCVGVLDIIFAILFTVATRQN